MTAIELIQYIIDNNLVNTVLNDIGCHSIKEYSTEYRCGQSGRKNKTSVVVKKDTLKIRIYQSDSKNIYGNIITLVMEIKNLSFVEANKYLHKLFGLNYKYNKNKKTKEELLKEDPLGLFKKIKRKRNSVNIKDIEIYDDVIIEEYEPLLHISWVKEGILEFTRKVFNIGYSYKHKRIVIPHRYWAGEENEYLGIMGRTTINDWEMLDIAKYYPLKAFPKGINLYGLQENYKAIQEAGYCVVAESEKSTLKRHSRLDGTVVAIGSHDITPEQVKILIGLDVEIIIAMDKGIDINHIRMSCDNFFGIRQISYIFDKYDLLKENEAPMDAPNEIYKYLLKHRIKYDEKERNEYYKWREKQEKKLNK